MANESLEYYITAILDHHDDDYKLLFDGLEKFGTALLHPILDGIKEGKLDIHSEYYARTIHRCYFHFNVAIGDEESAAAIAETKVYIDDYLKKLKFN